MDKIIDDRGSRLMSSTFIYHINPEQRKNSPLYVHKELDLELS